MHDALRNVKIQFAIREDLKDSVFRVQKGREMQHEKWESRFFKLKWNRHELRELIEKRIDFKFASRYTKNTVTSKDIFHGGNIDGSSPIDYIISRTLYRPREVILFLNKCIEKAEGKKKVDRAIIINAEHSYSEGRLKSLVEEWGFDHSLILHYCELLRNKSAPFRINTILDSDIENLMLDIFTKGDFKPETDVDSREYFQASVNGRGDKAVELSRLKRRIFALLYKVGVLGIKTSKTAPRQWSHIDDATLDSEKITEDATVDIHRAFWSSLNIRPQGQRTTIDDL